MNDKELNQLLIENRKMRKALEFIQEWKLPMVESLGESVSYETAKGSNGAREYIRAFASDALKS